MASSGTFTGSRYGGGSLGPYLTLAWSQVSQSVANNTTTLDLTLRFHWSGTIGYTFYSRTGSVQGHSYTYSGSVSGSNGGSVVLRTQRVTITHNSNGTKSVALSGNITSLGLNWMGTNVGTMSVSGTANLNTIPRATTMSAFSFNAHLKNGVANQINYTIDRKSTAFRHQIQLRDGDTVLRTWDNIDSNGASTLSLTATEVNSLLNRMSSSTTKSYTLRVATRSGVNGGWIGSAVSRNATATVHADVKPTVSALSLSQTGNSVSTHTLQGKSKITGSFTRSAGYGASITSSSITVRRKTTNNDVQTINSNSGTTGRAVSMSGDYEAQGMTRDSRGRTTYTAWTNFSVTAYSSPRITSFTAARSSSAETTVSISRSGTHTPLGGSNVLTYTVHRRIGTGAWTNVNTNATGTSTTDSFSGTSTSTGNSITTSYDFRLVITDKFGERAESIITVSTQRVVLDIHKNEGVGIGKIHERGTLDVGGNTYINGKTYAHGGIHFGGRSGLTVEGGGGFYNDNLPSGNLLSPDYWHQSLFPVGMSTWMGTPSLGLTNTPTSYGFVHVLKSTSNEVSVQWHTQSNGAVYRTGTNGLNYGMLWYIGFENPNHWAKPGDVLWTGGVYMTANQTITPSKPISECPNGWVLVWSDHDEGVQSQNWDWSHSLVSKGNVNLQSGNNNLFIIPSFASGATNLSVNKILYVHTNRIVGHDNNESTANQKDVVLRRVLAW